MKILIFSSTFPFGNNEVFLENEIKYLKQKKNINYEIIPSKKEIKLNIKRKEFSYNNFLIKKKNKSKFSKFLNFIFGIKYSQCRKEIIRVLLNNPKALLYSAYSISNFSFYVDVFKNYFNKCENLENQIIYTYWNTEITYALQFLKPIYNYSLVSRIHGFDLYKEVRPYRYMPLKKYFLKNIDYLFPISKEGGQYLITNYKFNKSIIKHFYLGVKDNNYISKQNKNNIFHIVSCSNLRRIKRIDKIIKLLDSISKIRKDIKFEWTHIGGGSLLSKYKSVSSEILSEVNFKFCGHLDNDEVYNFYKKNKIDLFLNTSESEGVPVSIMEAMGFGIPIIAPDIGGVSEIISDNKNGFLLPKKFNNDDLVNAVIKILNSNKIDSIKKESRKLFENKFTLESNYESFYNFLKLNFKIRG